MTDKPLTVEKLIIEDKRYNDGIQDYQDNIKKLMKGQSDE